MDTDRNSVFVKHVASEPVKDGPVIREKVSELMEEAVNQLTNKLDARIAQTTERSLVVIMENPNDDHKMSFVRGTLQRAARERLTSMMDDDGV